MSAKHHTPFLCVGCLRLLPGRRLGHLFYGLRFDLLGNSGLNSLVFLLGDLLPDLTVGRIATKDIRVEEGDGTHDTCHGHPHDPIKSPTNRSQNQIKEESPHGVEQKAKVHGNHNTEKLELGFKTANQYTTAYGVDRQNGARKCRKAKNMKDLCAFDLLLFCVQHGITMTGGAA